MHVEAGIPSSPAAGGVETERQRARLKRAELVSITGAAVLGAGVGALIAAYVGRYAVVLVIAGAVLHAWGMRERHRLEHEDGSERVWWYEALYWSCWIALLVVAGLIVTRMIGA